MAYHIAIFVHLPHVLRIKRYMPSWKTVQHQLLIWTVTTAQSHDTDLSTNQVHWTQHVSGDISAGFGISKLAKPSQPHFLHVFIKILHR